MLKKIINKQDYYNKKLIKEIYKRRFQTVNGSPLLLCNSQKQYNKIYKYISKGANVNATENTGNTPVIIAARRGNLPVLRLLRKFKADLNFKGEEGNTALILAAKNNQQSCVKYLIQAGAHINTVNDNGETALFMAVDRLHYAVTYILLLAGADPNIKSNLGYTPLILATSKSTFIAPASNVRYKFTNLLLSFGADPNLYGQQCISALEFICRQPSWGYEQENIIRILLSYGADLPERTKENKTPKPINSDFMIKAILYRMQIVNQCIGEIRKNARTLSLIRCSKKEESLLTIIPLEVLLEILALTNTEVFTHTQRKQMAWQFFCPPKAIKGLRDKEEENYIKQLKLNICKIKSST